MGMYDTFCHKKLAVQIKAGGCTLHDYHVGDTDHGLPDGVYVAREGVVTIMKGKVVGITEKLYTKWGGELDKGKVLEPQDPIVTTMNETYKKVTQSIKKKTRCEICGMRRVCTPTLLSR